ncbi:aspartic peptidase domain-containing protein [Phycomyces blakesleeanus]|uniref:Aspartic peptidase domain-containing protein n=1 Tax=Phycomyces blakesleeanus TaxID=4837 RepID=A0ABR3BGG0_PHYBL
MHLSTSILLCLGAVAVNAATVKHSPQVIRLPLIRNPNSKDIITQKRNIHLFKRDPAEAPLYNDDGSQYLVQLSVGTPAQNFTVTLDTGSQNFEITYGIGNVNGTFVTDTVTIAGVQVQNQQFGLASSTNNILTNPTTIGVSSQTSSSSSDLASNSDTVGNGILGMGFPLLTTSAGADGVAYYPLIFNMVDQKLITDPVFSIYMNTASSTGWAGELIIGGVDTSKYTGDIVYLPVAALSSTSTTSLSSLGSSANAYKGYYYWMVYGQGISLISGTTTTDVGMGSISAFIFDTGTTLTYLPQAMAKAIVSSVAGSNGYRLDSSSGTYMVDCNAVSSTVTVQLQMSTTGKTMSSPVTLNVPGANLIIPVDADTPEKASVCIFGIAPSSSSSSGGSFSMYLFGDSILRSAYLVFDIGNQRIGIAAANGVGGSVNGKSGGTSSSNTPSSSSSSSSGSSAKSGANPTLTLGLLISVLGITGSLLTSL